MAKIILSKQQIFSAKDIVTEDVPTPEWAPEGADASDCVTRIRNLTGAGRAVFIQKSLDMKAKQDKNEKMNFEVELLLVAMTAVDENNERLFGEDDVAILGGRNAAPITRCAEVASRLAGLAKEQKDAAAKI